MLLPPAALIPAGALDSMHGRASTATATAPVAASAAAATKQALARSTTIRSVPSFEASDSSPESRRSAFGSSVNSTASGSSAMSAAAAADGAAARPHHHADERTAAPAAARLKNDAAADTPVRWHAHGVRALDLTPAHHDGSAVSDAASAEPDASGHWDSTIGKAGLGKTGRVINRLVSDNDALKRDIQIEVLRAEEAKQAAKLIEDKMERMAHDYESRLLEANVTKTLLARKERQVETLTATVEAEKTRAAAALERERGWRDELERVRAASAAQVEEATGYAQLMEGRYNAITSHWRDQGDEVKRAVSGIRGDIAAIVEERRSDDDKIRILRELCEQQDSNIRKLRGQRDDISRLFDEYKQTQEDDLRAIRATARQREEEQQRLLDESRDVLAKLRWALSVKKNVKDAQ